MKKILLALFCTLLPFSAWGQTGLPTNIRDSATGNQAQVTGNALHVTFSNADTTGTTSSLNAGNATASVALAGYQGCSMFLASGTLAATLTPEVSMDGGTTWLATQFYDSSTQAFSATKVFTNPNAATEFTVMLPGGVSNCRVRVSSFTSGAASATMRATTAPNGATTVQGSVTVAGTVTANQGGAPWTQNLTQVVGSAIALGQTTMSASLPVAIASNQSTLPVNSQGFSSGFVTGQATVTGSAVALASNTVHSACVTADAGNTVAFFAGPSGVTTSTGQVLYPGDTRCWSVANTNQIFLIDASGSPLAYFSGI